MTRDAARGAVSEESIGNRPSWDFALFHSRQTVLHAKRNGAPCMRVVERIFLGSWKIKMEILVK